MITRDHLSVKKRKGFHPNTTYLEVTALFRDSANVTDESLSTPDYEEFVVETMYQRLHGELYDEVRSDVHDLLDKVTSVLRSVTVDYVQRDKIVAQFQALLDKLTP